MSVERPGHANAGESVVLRFAPSPTGRLHLGHALSALINLDLARRLGGRLLVRIEDTDLTRCRSQYVDGILEDLAWLGVQSDGPVLRQSDQLDVYASSARRLEAMGLLYRCYATRQEVLAVARDGFTDPDGAPLYPGRGAVLPPAETERRQQQGAPYAMRLDMAKAVARALALGGASALAYAELDASLTPRVVVADPARWGDVVLERKDIPASYHLAVVVDDARQGISHVVRGEDLAAATDIHRVLQVLLGLPVPLYRHHALIRDASGRKLAKRDADTSLAELRRRGLAPRDVRRLVGLEA